jgi:4-amino-4-deoxy-L-arabinose transferase-like glycosyltransferase
MDVTGPPLPRGRSRVILLVMIWTFITCFERLGEAPVYIDNEAREGLYVRAMLSTGDYILPTVPYHLENGESIPDKPPLFHWVACAGTFLTAALRSFALPDRASLDAAFNVWLLRLPSALAACLMMLAVLTLGARLVGERAAVLAGLGLLSSWQFCHQARFGRVDMLFAACVTFTLLLAWRALDLRHGASLYGAGALAGLAVLAKGPLGLFLPILVLGVWWLWKTWGMKSPARLEPLPWRRAALVAAAVALPWYIAAKVHDERALIRSHFVEEHLKIFLGMTGNSSPFTYVAVLVSSLPCAVLGFLALRALYLSWRRGGEPHAGAVFAAIWFLSIVCLFEMAGFKQRHYILPALPALALLAGWVLDGWLPHGEPRSLQALCAVLGRPTLALAALAGALAAWVVGEARLHGLEGPGLGLLDILLGRVGIALATAALVVALRALALRDRFILTGAATFLCSVVLVLIVPTRETVIGTEKSPVPLVRRIEANVPGGEIVTVRGLRWDPTVVLQMYAVRPERIHVLAEPGPPPEPLREGYYLLTESAWSRIDGTGGARDGSWKVLFTDVLPGHTENFPVRLVERPAERQAASHLDR